ncbi:MAG: hypothetical protein IIV79_00190 [Clostridia bacterium]|nr:hypothetical protein [Clostridia bacterium]
MNFIVFGLVLIVLCFNTQYSANDTQQFIDILPDFIGYLILWFALEKRRFNARMRGLYVAVSVLSGVSFLFFLGQIKIFFSSLITYDMKLFVWMLDGLNHVAFHFDGILLLAAVAVLGWLLFAMLGYWEQTNRHKLQCTVCKIGMILCGLAGLCHVGSTFIILPFSWHWISYPLSLLAIVCAWFVMKDSQEMLTGYHEPVKERRFGVKK